VLEEPDMKKLAITQRVEYFPSHQERRDCLDQRWSQLAFALDFVPIPLPNVAPEQVADLLETIQPDAIMLSGGNSVASLDDTADDIAPERDAFEFELLRQAHKRGIPIAGVCRGMQMINIYLGGSVSPIEGHVGCRHPLVPEHLYQGSLPTEVNSSHHWGIAPNELAPPLVPIAMDENGHIEGAVHQTDRISCILWHPEREEPFRPLEIELLKGFLS
jgi:gamma-glutamyl-gamma-aminobutyrate hydrolase PuuD